MRLLLQHEADPNTKSESFCDEGCRWGKGSSLVIKDIVEGGSQDQANTEAFGGGYPRG